MNSELLQIINEAESIIERQNKLCQQFNTKLKDVFVELLEIQHKIIENKNKYEDNFYPREANS